MFTLASSMHSRATFETRGLTRPQSSLNARRQSGLTMEHGARIEWEPAQLVGLFARKAKFWRRSVNTGGEAKRRMWRGSFEIRRSHYDHYLTLALCS